MNLSVKHIDKDHAWWAIAKGPRIFKAFLQLLVREAR